MRSALVAVAVAALSLTACTPDPPATPGAASDAAPTSAPAQPSPPSTRDNERTTARYADWLLHAVPMPKGAREWKTSPVDQFRTATLGVSPSDRRFQRTTWWTVPLGLGDFERWVSVRVPARLRLEDGAPGESMSMGRTEYDLDLLGRSTAAHTSSVLNLAIVERAGGVVVRVDTFVGARFGRTATVPENAEAVTVRRVRTSTTGAHPATHSVAVHLTDPAVVRRLVDLVNGQPGAMTVTNTHSCPAMLAETTWTLTFATKQGEWTAVGTGNACYPELVLRRDGAKAGPTLEPDRSFDRQLDALLRNASAPAAPHS